MDLNGERAVVTVEALAQPRDGAGGGPALDISLVFRVRRRSTPWVVVGVDSLVRGAAGHPVHGVEALGRRRREVLAWAGLTSIAAQRVDQHETPRP